MYSFELRKKIILSFSFQSKGDLFLDMYCGKLKGISCVVTTVFLSIKDFSFVTRESNEAKDANSVRTWSRLNEDCLGFFPFKITDIFTAIQCLVLP